MADDAATIPSYSGDDRRMSDAEALMWRLEKDPYLSSNFGTVTILDRAPDFDRLRARMEQALTRVPRLRWRVQPNPGDLGAPVWADDPELDIDYHVRRISLPSPGTLRQLYDLAAVLTLDPFDRTRPLWQFTVIEGLPGGQAALLAKMHHTITDGINGVRMSMEYLDLDRSGETPMSKFSDLPPVEGPPPAPAPDDAMSALTAVRSVVEGSFRLPLAIAKEVRGLLADPANIPKASAAAFGTVRGLISQLSDIDHARSPLWTKRSMFRSFETVRTQFEPTRAAAKRLGGSINAAFLTAAAEAASRYHVEFGAPTPALRASMAISTRTEESGANAFGVVRMLVPTDEMPIAKRFALVADIAGAARRSSGSGAMDAVAAIATALPTSLMTRLARQQTQSIDFATSNVRASPVPVYVAGAKTLANYPIGPLAGVAFNATMISYDGNLDVGLNIDAAAVEHPARLAELLDTSFKDLHRAKAKTKTTATGSATAKD
jgi:WS/DGAT/MGAT family acyltransferase